MLNRIWTYIRRKLLTVQPPKVIPEDTVTVLTVYRNKITGWQTPASARERRVWYKPGAKFVCLSQADIDQFIPSHSEDVDEQTRERREELERVC